MNKPRTLVLVPVVVAILLVVAHATVSTDDPDRVYFYAGLVAKGVAAIGAFLAASRFSRGDHLHAAWWLLATSYALLVGKDLVWGYETQAMASTLTSGEENARSVVLLVSNLASVAAMVQFARSWSVAGLAPSESSARRWAVTIGALALAILIAGKGAWADLNDAGGGKWGNAAGDFGDILSFVLIAPVLLTALALRGGLLVWPWALLTASNIGWLGYDAFVTVTHLAGIDGRLASEIIRVTACALVLAAGAAQRMVTARPT
jgi:hypothetical protein